MHKSIYRHSFKWLEIDFISVHWKRVYGTGIGVNMKEYEVVHEIFNQCSGNQMRDVFIEETEIADLEAYVTSRHQDKDFTFEREDLADGTVIYHVNTSGILQRYTFTEL